MNKITELIVNIVAKILFFGPIAAWVLRGIFHSNRNDAIRSNGIKASAVIKKIELGGRAIGNEFYPAVKLRVLVENEKGWLFYAQIETTIAVTHMSKFQPGSKIDVAYDPADPTKAAVLSPTK